MPNSIAYLVLALWPLVMFVLFKRLPVGRALVWSFLGGYLLLPPPPAAFDFPLMPPLNKLTLPNLTALFFVIFVAKEKIEFWPRSRAGKVLMGLFIFSPIFTVLTNPEPVIFATGGLRGLLLRDIVALVVTQALLLSGFILARQFLNTRDSIRDLLLALVICGVVYSFPMLLEVRLSPQINVWVYGYFQHVFEQVIRSGGYRAVVFLQNGIWAAMFIMMALASAVILWRASESKARSGFLISAMFLGLVLVLNKTLAPVVYSIVLLGMVFFTGWKTQTRVAVVLASLALAYPLAKGVGLVPEEQMLKLASTVNEERAYSLEFRFENENALYQRALEKPIFGWGTWGRNHIRNPVDGTIETVTDGRWIITIGVFGWIGFLAEFGLLALPIFLFARASGQNERGLTRQWKSSISAEIPVTKVPEERVIDTTISPMIGGMALLLALNLVDLLPNATITPITWLIAGAILGYAERLTHRVEAFESKRKKTALEAAPRVELPKGPRTVL